MNGNALKLAAMFAVGICAIMVAVAIRNAFVETHQRATGAILNDQAIVVQSVSESATQPAYSWARVQCGADSKDLRCQLGGQK